MLFDLLAPIEIKFLSILLQGAAQEAVASIPHVVRPARPNRDQVPQHPAHTFSWTCTHVFVACHHVGKPLSDSLVGHLAASLKGVDVGKSGLTSFVRMSIPPEQEVAGKVNWSEDYTESLENTGI